LPACFVKPGVASMKISFPFRNLMPTFFAGLLDDPLLLLRTRSNGRHFMFDCGQLHHLAKRSFTNLDAIFVSHAHMDHWMGIDSVVRHLIAAGKTVDIYGGPGIADKFEHKLSGYDWNLAEDYWSNFKVHEVFPDRIDCELFPGNESFIRRSLPAEERNGPLIYQNDFLKVSADCCEHRVDSLIYRIDERPTYLIDRQKLEAMQLVPGPWIGELKRCFLQQLSYPAELKITCREGNQFREIVIRDVGGLVAQLNKPQRTSSIGYVSDIGFSRQNREKVLTLMEGVDLLLCECTFLREAEDRARSSSHLCTSDVNELLAELKPRFFLPMHLSRSYSRRHQELYQELEPPEETTLLQLPLQLTPRPLLANEIDWHCYSGPER